MAITSLRLVDGDLSMTLYPRDDAQVLSLDVPAPEVRVVSEPRPEDDGVRDTTSRHGARPVAIELQAIERPATLADELARWMHPARRPFLVMADDEWGQERRLRLRSDNWSAPLSAELAPWVRRILGQWSAPDGVWEAVDQTQLIIGVDIPSSIGMSFPMSFPIAFDQTNALGAQETSNVGSAPSHLLARLYGPITAPRLINTSTGQALAFTSDLVLGAGEYVEVDTRNRTAYLNGDVGVSRLEHVDFSVNQWWRLQAGIQLVRYTGTAPSPGARAVLYYRPAWL